MYVDMGVETKLTPTDHRWVGAWWLGFAVFAAAAAFWTIWALGFPKEFPGTKYLRLTAENDPDKNLVGKNLAIWDCKNANSYSSTS